MLMRSGPPALAAVAAGWIAAVLPFYPASWPVLLAVVAAGLTALRARAGLAFALAVPVFPLGNVSFGLAVLYAMFAVGWLVLMWGDARRGLLLCAGLMLGPVGLLGLMPVVALQSRGFVRRAGQAAAAVLLAGAAAGIHGRLVPFTASGAPPLPVAESEHPIAVLQSVWQWLLATPELGVEAVILGLAAASLPLVSRGSDLTIATLAAAFIASTMLAAPAVSALPLLICGWAVYLTLTVLSRRLPERSGKRHALGTILALTRTRFLDRVKPAGGPRWPRARPQQRFRGAGAG
jgi:hypothetical protein